ncbi:hypothetical protein CEXT_533901 [Caerostris extrusa]|uniref:Uncharacterized protein n=1 Tax=Caerostris extrusa TaxID=172846 RepID=A0AAV4N1F6_CAEEX|nr:hypothetical protein CEXT_533901 [Caerostris extrusa]
MKRLAIHYHISSHLFPRITKSDLARAPEAIRRQMIADPELQVRRALEPKVSPAQWGPGSEKKKNGLFSIPSNVDRTTTVFQEGN